MDGMGPVQPTEPYYNKGQWGWNGSQWVKLPLLFGYGGLIGEDLSDTNLDAGTNTLASASVPAGEIWVVTLVALRYDGTPPTTMWIRPSGLPGNPPFHVVTTIATLVWYPKSVWCVLGAGDRVEVLVLGATAGDSLYGRFCGYKMAVT